MTTTLEIQQTPTRFWKVLHANGKHHSKATHTQLATAIEEASKRAASELGQTFYVSEVLAEVKAIAVRR